MFLGLHYIVNFSVRPVQYFQMNFNFFLPIKRSSKHLKKLLTYGRWAFFFSAAPTAQNSPELHFRFINSFIQPSLVGSLVASRRISKYIVLLLWPDPSYCYEVLALYKSLTSLGHWKRGQVIDEKHKLGHLVLSKVGKYLSRLVFCA